MLIALDNDRRARSAFPMKPKQLAAVLIKVLGLSLCAHSLSTVIASVIGFPFTIGLASGGSRMILSYLTSMVYGIVPFAIGLWLILGTKWFVERLFTDEEQ